MFTRNRILSSLVLSLALLACIGTDAKEPKVIRAGSKVYVAPMDGFETYLKDAIQKKQVPLTVVESKQDADYEIAGVAQTAKGGVKKALLGQGWGSREEASVQVTDLKAGVVVFAHSYLNSASWHGKRSSAESCAKHLKEAIKPQ